MSVEHNGLWSYEFVSSRSKQAWRVADSDDDPIASFETQEEALEFAGKHNDAIRLRDRRAGRITP
jgi:hypothetical protein